MKIKIGGKKFKVKFIKGLVSDDSGIKLNGYINYQKSTIDIEKNLDKQAQEIVILHEIIHGVLDHAGQEHDEVCVDIISRGIYQVLRDNYNFRLL